MNRRNRDAFGCARISAVALCFLLWLPTYAATPERISAPDPSNVMYASVLQFGTADAAENLFLALEALRSRGLLRYRGFMFAFPDVSAKKDVTPARFAGSVDASGTRIPWPAGVVAGHNANAFLCRINHPHACLDRPNPNWRIRLYTESSHYKPPTRKELDDFCTTQNLGRAKRVGAPWHFVLCLPDVMIEETVFLKRVPFNPMDPTEKSLAHKILEQNGCPASLRPSEDDVPQIHARRVWCSEIFRRISLAELARLNGDGPIAVAVRAGCRKNGELSLAALRKEWCDETERKLAEDPVLASAEKAMAARGQNEIQIPTIALQLTHDVRSSELKKLEIAVASVRASLNMGSARAPSAAISFQRAALFTHYKQQIFLPQKPLKTEAAALAKANARQATCADSIDEALAGDGFNRAIRDRLEKLVYQDSLLIADNDFPLGAKDVSKDTDQSDPARVLLEGQNDVKGCQIARWKVPSCQPPTQHDLRHAEKHAAAIESLIRGRRGNGALGIFDSKTQPAVGFYRFRSTDSPPRGIEMVINQANNPNAECRKYGFSVVSMSLSGRTDIHQSLKNSVKQLSRQGILMVVPAGEVQRNVDTPDEFRDCSQDAQSCAYKSYDSPRCPAYPACESVSTPMVLSVVGIDPKTNEPLPEQRYGPRFDVAAAGKVPVSINGGLQTFAGASSSVPIVASLALALKAEISRVTRRVEPAAIKRRIQFTSNPEFDTKTDAGVSRPIARFGRINFDQALDFERDKLKLKNDQVLQGFLHRSDGNGKDMVLKFKGVRDNGVDKEEVTIPLVDIRRIAYIRKSGLFFVVFADQKRSSSTDVRDANPLHTLRDATLVGQPEIQMFKAGPRNPEEQFELDVKEPLSQKIKVSDIKDFIRCSITDSERMKDKRAKPDITCDGN